MSNLKRVCVTVMSVSIIFVKMVPNFTNAVVRAPKVIPMQLLYDVKNDVLEGYGGEIIDYNDENTKWELGEYQTLAILRVNGEFIKKVEIPLNSFACSYKYPRRPQRVKYNSELQEWLNKNSGDFLGCSEMGTLEICTSLFGIVEGSLYDVKLKLCEIDIYSDYLHNIA